MANQEPTLEALVTELAQLRATLTTQQDIIARQQAAISTLQQAASTEPTDHAAPVVSDVEATQPTRVAYVADRAPLAQNAVDDDQASATDALDASEPRSGLTSRRGLLRGAAAATAAATVAGVALSASQPAHAAPLTTGGNFILGQANDAGATTSLANTASTTPTSTLQVSNDVVNLANAAISTTTAGANGVYALESNGGNGVLGVGLTSLGYGVYGRSDSGWGVVGDSGTGADIASIGTGMIFQGLQTNPGAPSSTLDIFSGGESIRDSNGDLWLCVAAGSPGTWVKAAHTKPGFTGGAINFLPVPIRVIDTRPGQNPAAPLPTTKAPLMSGQTYAFQITGTMVGTSSVPAGAVGIYANITVVFPTNGGNLIFYPADQTQPQSSTINYAQGAVVGNFSVIGLSASGAVKVFVNGPANTDVVVDIAGFIM